MDFADETLEGRVRMVTHRRFATLPGAGGQLAHRDRPNGYEIAAFLTQCPDTPAAPGNPLVTLHKPMRGRAARHIPQFARRYRPHRDKARVAPH